MRDLIERFSAAVEDPAAQAAFDEKFHAIVREVKTALERCVPVRPDLVDRKPIGATELVESVAFQGGSMCVQVNGAGDSDGSGYFVLAAEDLEVDVSDDGYRVAKVRPMDLLAMRDFLNRLFPVPTEPQVLHDIESLLRGVSSAGEWQDEHEEILDRWRALRGEEGKSGWRWWWKRPGDDLYQTDHATRDEALAAALREDPAADDTVELIEARCWSDDINVEDAMFAESRNYERVRVVDHV